MTDKGEFGFFKKTGEWLRWLGELLADPTKELIFHNAKFDVKAMAYEGLDVLNAKAKIHCTLILSKLFNMNGWHDLLGLGIRYLNRNPADKTEIETWLRQHNKPKMVRERGRKLNFSDVPTEIVKRRVLWDVETTLKLFAYLYPRVQSTSPDLYATERELILVTVEMELIGVQIDITRAKKLRAVAMRGIETIQQELDKLICPLHVVRLKKGVEVEEDHETFNVNSTAIQMPAAFQKLGIELKFKTKPKKGKKGKKASGGGRWSFDEYSMVRYVPKDLAALIRDSSEEGWSFDKFYAELHKLVKDKSEDTKARELLPPLVLKLRELKKMVTTYYDHLIEECVDVHRASNGREYGTLHCSFNQNEALTGRYSSSGPNLQNMPRLLGPRECFVRRLGYRNWHFDYEQVEMKFFVHFARDRRMAKAIEDDIHLEVASIIYKQPRPKVSKERRKRAKAVNFGILYGAGPPKMAETLTQKGLPTSKLEASKLCADYHRSFPSVRKTTQALKRDIERQGFVVNPFGRRYHISTKESYKALNYECQGTSADLMKRGMLRVWKHLRKHGYKSRIIMTIHDEVVLQIPRNEEKKLVPEVRALLEDRTSFFVPITVGVEYVTHRWSKKKDFQDVGRQIPAKAS